MTQENIVYRRGEMHMPNPNVNREKRPQILLKRIRNITRTLAKDDAKRSVDKMSLAKRYRLEGKLATYKGGA